MRTNQTLTSRLYMSMPRLMHIHAHTYPNTLKQKSFKHYFFKKCIIGVCLFSQLNPKPLGECLAHSRCSINGHRTNESWSPGDLIGRYFRCLEYGLLVLLKESISRYRTSSPHPVPSMKSGEYISYACVLYMYLYTFTELYMHTYYMCI